MHPLVEGAQPAGTLGSYRTTTPASRSRGADPSSEGPGLWLAPPAHPLPPLTWSRGWAGPEVTGTGGHGGAGGSPADSVQSTVGPWGSASDLPGRVLPRRQAFRPAGFSRPADNGALPEPAPRVLVLRGVSVPGSPRGPRPKDPPPLVSQGGAAAVPHPTHVWCRRRRAAPIWVSRTNHGGLALFSWSRWATIRSPNSHVSEVMKCFPPGT